MNERIKQLAKQAGLEFDDDEALEFGKQIYYVTTEDMEKFAELIIQECMDVALDKKKWVEDQVVFDPRDQAWNKARVQQSQHIIDKIKEHFGVEE
jgi:hypothetical protein